MPRVPAVPLDHVRNQVAPFEVVSDCQPAGDQPAAIAEIERRLNAGTKDVVLMGATGTGKTATTAWLAERLQRPMLVLLPHNAVEYFVSYYDYNQPEAYVPQTDTYIEKDSSINEEVERLRQGRTGMDENRWNSRAQRTLASTFTPAHRPAGAPSNS